MTDRHGALVAASGVTSDYLQADEPWWNEANSTGQVSVGDVQWDESARVFAINIAVPVLDPVSQLPIGVLKAAANVRELFAAISGLQSGEGAEPVLLRTDGSIVFSRQSADPNARFYAIELLREQLQTIQPGDPDYQLFFRAQSREQSPQLVAIASTQLAQSYPQLPWLVAVSASEAELFAPVREQARNLLLWFATMAVVALVIVLALSIRVAVPRNESMEMHLVEHAETERHEEG